MPNATKLEKKEQYDQKLCSLMDSYDTCLLVHADNVGSKQFMDIRRALRELESPLLMGKNTLIRRCMRLYCERTGNEEWANLIPSLVGNVGMVFTRQDLSTVRDKIAEFKKGAAARVGVLAPNDVVIPAGSTGLDPSQTSFFQVLNIATKINKGTIEIVQDVKVCTAGEKVGASEATLLSKLGIKPFQYGLVLQSVFEKGSLYDPKVLDITDEDLSAAVSAGIQQVAALSLGANYPTELAVPHLLVEGYKNVLAIAIETDNPFPQAEKVFAYLADPSAFVVETAPAAGGGGGAAAAPAPVEEEEEEEEDMGFSLFD